VLAAAASDDENLHVSPAGGDPPPYLFARKS
jgi:hypothetical protein